MKKYCLDKNHHEDCHYELHSDDCEYLPPFENRINLGFHDIAATAIAQAQKLYPEVSEKIQGCSQCIKDYAAKAFI